MNFLGEEAEQDIDDAMWWYDDDEDEDNDEEDEQDEQDENFIIFD